METEGLIIKSTKYGEGSRMLTILTPQGKVEAAANGANSLRSRLFACSQLFCYSKIVLKKGKGTLPYTSSCDVVENFYGIRNDVLRVSLGVYFCELLGIVAVGEDTERELRFALNTLHMLEKAEDYTYLKPLFEMRLMALAGFMPYGECCGICGGRERLNRFSVEKGGALCDKCGGGKRVSEATLEAINYICTASDKLVFSFRVSKEVEKELWQVCEEYLLYQIERTPSKLQYLQKMLDNPQ